MIHTVDEAIWLLHRWAEEPYDEDNSENLRMCLNTLLLSRDAIIEREKLATLPNKNLVTLAKRYASTMPDSQAADILGVIAKHLEST